MKRRWLGCAAPGLVSAAELLLEAVAVRARQPVRRKAGDAAFVLFDVAALGSRVTVTAPILVPVRPERLLCSVILAGWLARLGHTTWMPRSCCSDDMVAASMPYDLVRAVPG